MRSSTSSDLVNGQFPLTSLGGAGFQVGGTFAGVTFNAEGFLATTTGANGQSILYGGIDGGVDIAGLAGFQIMLGLSSLGPLDVYAMVDAPIILDPDTGLALTDLSAGINFGGGLTPPDSAKDLTKVAQSAFAPTLSQWESQLAGDVADQISSGASWTDPPTLLTIQGGATLFDAYASTDSFELTGNIAFDTTGKLLASGTVTMGGSIKVQGSVFIDLSQVASGKAELEMNVTAPADTPIVTAYGTVDFEFDGPVFNAVQVSDRFVDAPARRWTGARRQHGLRLGPEHRPEQHLVHGRVLGPAERDRAGGVCDRPGSVDLDDRALDRVRYQQRLRGEFRRHDPELPGGPGHLVASVGRHVRQDDRHALDLPRRGPGRQRQRRRPIQGASTTLLLGKSGSIYFGGGVDEVRVWTVARTAAQIEDNLALQTPSPTTGLLADWSFSEGQGTTAADSSGNGNTMTLTGGVTWAPTVIAGASQMPAGPITAETASALELDGTDAYASASGINLNDSSFTIEFWAKQNDTARLEYIINQGDPPSSGGLQIGFDASNNFFVSFGGTTLTAPTNDNNWHEWAVTFDATTGTAHDLPGRRPGCQHDRQSDLDLGFDPGLLHRQGRLVLLRRRHHSGSRLDGRPHRDRHQ